MSDPVTPEAPVSTDPAGQNPPAAPQSNDGLPEWARKQISDANQEAANYRVQLRNTENERNALSEKVASLTSENAQAATSLSIVQSDFDKLATAVDALVPDKRIFAFAKTLQGSTSDELTAHASDLKEMFGSPISAAVDRSQGLGNPGAASDPASQFASFVQSQINK
ncbi:hypothetical protein [Mycobacteroides chelonae]|uniref:hypothetical protein n=1 Tax=Mycobacteroides chelonae TaxID=1774 RepID=UPI0004AB31C7|nr:hypothetical protein [Mycobacteroides chelonae]OHT67772.1 hypothetical protein BKG66_24400 [Mycobacteroides chelonae]OHT69415.1 hypothetical protein BKG67_22935 [Mycobacteroides chelonae]